MGIIGQRITTRSWSNAGKVSYRKMISDRCTVMPKLSSVLQRQTKSSKGIVNNRVFEVLSAGAPLISDHFDALEKKFGTDVILFYKQKGDVKYWLERVLHNESLRQRLKEKGRQHILDRETWAHRAAKMLEVFAPSEPRQFSSTSTTIPFRIACCGVLTDQKRCCCIKLVMTMAATTLIF